MSGVTDRTQPVLPVAPGVDRAEQQQDRQDRAQPPRITARPARQPAADPQSAHRRFHAPPVRFPQAGRGVVERPARPIGKSCERPVLQAARLLDAAARGEGIRE